MLSYLKTMLAPSRSPHLSAPSIVLLIFSKELHPTRQHSIRPFMCKMEEGKQWSKLENLSARLGKTLWIECNTMPFWFFATTTMAKKHFVIIQWHCTLETQKHRKPLPMVHNAP